MDIHQFFNTMEDKVGRVFGCNPVLENIGAFKCYHFPRWQHHQLSRLMSIAFRKSCAIGWKYRSPVVSISIYVPYDSGLGQYMHVLLHKVEFLSVLEVFNGLA